MRWIIRGNPSTTTSPPETGRRSCRLRRGKSEKNGIVIYALLKEDPSRIVMIRQYRYPLDAWLYELPAGLIDGQESPHQAAVREMKEETGLSCNWFD